MLVSTITGRPGTLREFVSMALPPGTQMNITELRHRCFCQSILMLPSFCTVHYFLSDEVLRCKVYREEQGALLRLKGFS